MRLSGVTNEAADKQLRQSLWRSFSALFWNWRQKDEQQTRKDNLKKKKEKKRSQKE